MLNWFEKSAPIRTKFKALLAIHGALSGIGLVTTILAVDPHGAAIAPVLIGLAGFAFAATILTVIASGQRICTPYVNTVVRMEALAAGDTQSEIRYTDYKDCVGRMTKAMSVFRQNLEDARATEAQRKVVSRLGDGLRLLAGGDLRCTIDETFPGEFEALRTDFNAAIAALDDALGAVAASAGGINTGAIEIRQSSDDLSLRTERQAASLEETAAAIDQLSSAVRQSAEGANRANTLVGEARSLAEQGGDVVSRAVDAMGGIERSSNEIAEIISVIDGIAFQTNLLALNAGVEAARAGEAGRGFAVVASEVRALAQRSAEAAKDVKARIHGSSQQVEVGVDLVRETGQSLQRIIARVGEVSGLVSDMAQSARQQATGLQQVNTAVSEMDGVTQQNAAMVEQATAAARNLAGESDELSRQVVRFQLATPVAASADTQASVHRLAPRSNGRRAAAR